MPADCLTNQESHPQREYPVLISGKRYSPEFQTDQQYAKNWKIVLEKAYGTHAICQCPSSGSRKLSIKRREDSDGFHLARFADFSGREHSNDCRYYAPAPERSGMQGYAVGVVEEGEDGSIRVRLARGIRVQAPRSGKRKHLGDRSPGKSKPAMTLLGLLHLLWSGLDSLVSSNGGQAQQWHCELRASASC